MKRPGDFQIVNHSVPRLDGGGKVTGRAVFTGDVVLPEMVHAKVLRSPYAHARLLSVNTAAASERPGVIGVLTGADLEGLDPYYGHTLIYRMSVDSWEKPVAASTTIPITRELSVKRFIISSLMIGTPSLMTIGGQGCSSLQSFIISW